MIQLWNNATTLSLFYRHNALLPILWLSVLLSGVSHAQIPPDSGDLLQQQQTPLAAPRLQKDHIFELQPQAVGTDSKPFFVSSITLHGNEQVPTSALAPIISEYQNKELTFNDLQLLCYGITQHYRRQGFLFARAVVPQQTLKDGALELQVIEARLGEIRIDNQSPATTQFLDRVLSQAPAGKAIKENTLNRALLLLQDVPGIKVRTAIRAGQSLGLSDLRVAVTKQSPKHQLSVHNFGSRSTHRMRLNGGLNFANLLGTGDLLAATLSTSGERMVQGGINYELGLGDNSNRLGFQLSYLDYALGENLKDLNAEGQASTLAMYWRHHWLRNLSANLSSNVQLQRQSLDDQLDNGAFLTERDVDSLLLSLTGDIRDFGFDNSISSLTLAATIGELTFSNPEARARDRLSANSQGRFSRVNLSLQHRQALSPELELSARLSAQWAQDNLDSSQKQGTTGPYAVRGYDVGGVSGDSATLLSTELQYRFSDTDYGRFAFYGFIDAAQAQLNQHRWAEVSGKNRVSLAGAGFGLRWQHQDWNSQLFVAAPIGNKPDALPQTKTGLLWFQIGRSF